MLDRKPSWERYWDGAQYWCESLGEVLAEQLPYLEKIPSLAEKQAEGQKYPRDEVTDPKIEQSRRRGRARQHKIIRRAVGRLASDVTKQRREAAGSWGPWGRKSQEEIDCFRKVKFLFAPYCKTNVRCETIASEECHQDSGNNIVHTRK